jgi:hypothetical protein
MGQRDEFFRLGGRHIGQMEAEGKAPRQASESLKLDGKFGPYSTVPGEEQQLDSPYPGFLFQRQAVLQP